MRQARRANTRRRGELGAVPSARSGRQFEDLPQRLLQSQVWTSDVETTEVRTERLPKLVDFLLRVDGNHSNKQRAPSTGDLTSKRQVPESNCRRLLDSYDESTETTAISSEHRAQKSNVEMKDS